MPTPSDGFASRFDDLNRRVARIEARLGVADAPTSSAVPACTDTRSNPPTPPRPRPTPKPGALLVSADEPQGFALERFVGGRLFAVVGALVVIVGAGLGLKLAWDLGYFRLLSDVGKSVAMGGFGAALLVLGELARRRWGRAAGEGLSAAGLGVLFATVYAMTARFELMGWFPAVGALVVVAGVGFAVSARSGMVVTPAVAVVGGFAAPVLLGEPGRAVGVLPLYWIALSAAAHALSAFRGSNFAGARTCAWWGSVLVGGLWALSELQGGSAGWALVYVAGVWVLSHAELWRACARREGDWPKNLLERSVAAGVSTTLWATLFGFVGARVFHWELWVAPAVFALANLCIALALVGARGLLRTPEDARTLLAVCLAFLAGALAMATALLAFGGWFEPVLFVLAGLACVASGARARASWLSAYGFLNLSLGALIALGSVELRDGTSVAIGALELTRWSGVVGVAAASWLGAALVDRWQPYAPGLAAACLVLFGVSFVSDDPDLRWLMGAWGALSGVFVLMQRATPTLRPAAIGLGGLLATASVWWLAFEALAWSEGITYGSGIWSVHEGLVGAVVLVGALLATARVVRRTGEPGGTQAVFAGVGCAAAAALALAATSLETARLAELATDDETARRAAVSIWWGVYAIALLAIGGWKHVALTRHAGLALIGVATLKAVLFDLAAVAPGWRVASFLLLGLLLLGVATAYARWASRERATTRTGASR